MELPGTLLPSLFAAFNPGFQNEVAILSVSVLIWVMSNVSGMDSSNRYALSKLNPRDSVWLVGS